VDDDLLDRAELVEVDAMPMPVARLEDDVRERTRESPFARAYFTLLDELDSVTASGGDPGSAAG
jgi:hypothetical protein